jgi:hypothetical protein
MAIPANGETDNLLFLRDKRGQVAQLVEQRTENPRVGGSTPSLATIKKTRVSSGHFNAMQPSSSFSILVTSSRYGLLPTPPKSLRN